MHVIRGLEHGGQIPLVWPTLGMVVPMIVGEQVMGKASARIGNRQCKRRQAKLPRASMGRRAWASARCFPFSATSKGPSALWGDAELLALWGGRVCIGLIIIIIIIIIIMFIIVSIIIIILNIMILNIMILIIIMFVIMPAATGEKCK